MQQTRTLLILGALGALALTGRPAHADLVMEVLNSSATPGGTGSFDVDLLDNGGTFNVSGFSFGLSVPTVSGVTFTGVNTGTASAPYIFGTYQSAPSPFSFQTFPNTTFTASDSDFTAPYVTTLTNGSVFGLGHVTYAVASGTALGPVPVSLVPAGDSLSDINGNAIPFTPQSGTITVAATNAVPEPGTLPALSLGLLCLAACSLRTRRRNPGIV